MVGDVTGCETKIQDQDTVARNIVVYVAREMPPNPFCPYGEIQCDEAWVGIPFSSRFTYGLRAF